MDGQYNMTTNDAFLDLSGLLEAIDHHPVFTDTFLEIFGFGSFYEASIRKIVMLSDNFNFASLYEAAIHEVPIRYRVPAIELPQFMRFPAEVRANIIDQYLHEEVTSNAIAKALHRDRFGSPCCVWLWPNSLIICDKADPASLPHPVFPRWYPNFALTNHQIRGEVAVHMLKTTEQFTLKYEPNHPAKISRWFSRFLASFPHSQGTDAVKDLNFPHIHWYASTGQTTALTNPDVDLMLQCRNLTRVRFTFHTFAINGNPNECYPELPQGNQPLNITAFVDKFKLRPMVGCDNLQEVWLGGIKYLDYVTAGGDQSKALRDFGAWLHREFGKKVPPQKVKVVLFPRYGAFSGWRDGEEI